jgi:acyl carrier protein
VESKVDTIRAAINEVLTESGREAVPSLARETRLRKDLGLDSLELAILTVKLEAVTGVDIFAQGIVATVGEIEDRLSAQ